MTQTSILAPGNTTAVSADIVVPAGMSVTIGLYSAAPGFLPCSVPFVITQDTPGADNYVTSLRQDARSTVLSGPGTYRVSRPAYSGDAFGVFMED